ncbi:MAG: hypothetical protein II738_06515, partial [Clostridia bacterium]|nr:hypothetical protein [Clostridia bacterium]
YSATADLTMYIAQTQFYAITVDSQIENGEILVEDEDGNEITGAYDHQLLHVVFNADAGYRPCGLTVTDAGGNVVSDSAAIFCMPASAITVTAAFTPEPLQMGENTVYIESATQSYSFTPSQDGIYRFYSVGEYDPALYIYYNGNPIDNNDDHDGYNFDLTVALEGGKTYTLEIPSYDTVGVDTGMLTMWIERADLPYDINVDGVMDESDYDLVVLAALGDVTLTPVQQAKANLNGDDVIDVLDCLEFKRLLNPQP